MTAQQAEASRPGGFRDALGEPGMRMVLGLAAVRLVIPLLNAEPFGYFRDELYYIVCGLRLDWGYVDHPAMAPLFAAAGWKLFGETLYGLRFFPALFGAATVALTGAMARALGAGIFGQALAALALLLAPFYVVSGAMLTTNSFELFFWAALAYVVLLLVKRRDPRLWLWFGVFGGLGLHAKHSVAIYAFALLAALLLAGQWRLVVNRWLVFGGLVALAIALPNLLWQWQHGWPTYELLTNVAQSNKNVVLGPVRYFLEQIFLLGPLAFPLWLGGLIWLLRARDHRTLRAHGLAYLVAFTVIVALKGKNYYLAPAYPLLFAAGAVAFERLTAARLRWMRAAYAALIVISVALLFPIGVPVFSPEKTAAYQRALGIEPPRTERSHTAELPQHLADRLGWEEMAASVARAYQALPLEDRVRAGIFAQNFGEAGAIDILGRKHGLPPALSGHQNYFLWGPRGYTGEVMLVVDDEPGSLPEVCGSVTDLGALDSHPHAMPYEQRQRLYLCRDLRLPLAELWPRVKRYY
jgi:hypothetical protein